MAIRDARSRHARTTPQGYPPPEAYGPVGPFVPQQGVYAPPVPAQVGPPYPHHRPATPPHPHHRPAGTHAATPTNALAVGGFVVAVIGVVLSLLPVLGLLGWLLCPIGLGLSVAGLTRVPRYGGSGRGLAVAGVVLGALGLVVCLLWVLALTR